MTKEQFRALETWMKAVASEPFQKHKDYLPSCRANAFAALVTPEPEAADVNEIVSGLERLRDVMNASAPVTLYPIAYVPTIDAAIAALLNGE